MCCFFLISLFITDYCFATCTFFYFELAASIFFGSNEAHKSKICLIFFQKIRRKEKLVLIQFYLWEKRVKGENVWHFISLSDVCMQILINQSYINIVCVFFAIIKQQTLTLNIRVKASWMYWKGDLCHTCWLNM